MKILEQEGYVVFDWRTSEIKSDDKGDAYGRMVELVVHCAKNQGFHLEVSDGQTNRTLYEK